MKILLLGEYSGFQSNLKDGLIELGHEVVIAATGDGFKKIKTDISFEPNKSNILSLIMPRWNPLLYMDSLKGYDVVQVINPFIFGRSFPSWLFFKKLKSQNGKLFFSAAGDDAYYWRIGRNKLKYGPFDDSLAFDLKKKTHFLEKNRAFKFNTEMIDLSDGIIPVTYEYDLSYASSRKKLAPIQIPINHKKIQFFENSPKGKMVIFHGLNRYGFKGTRYVEEAFNILKKKYPNDLELIIDGKMPYDQYLKLLSRTNVIIDQVNSYSCGVNALIGLAMGKVMLGGNEPESLACFGITESPVINIIPDPLDIVQKVEFILEYKNSIPNIGLNGRKFVEEHHDHITVASKYLERWMSV